MQEMQSLSVISSSFLQAFVYKLDFSDPSSQKNLYFRNSKRVVIHILKAFTK